MKIVMLSPRHYKIYRAIKNAWKKYFFGTCFMCLKGYLGTFRKSHKVSAVEIDPIGVKLGNQTDLGLFGPPPPTP